MDDKTVARNVWSLLSGEESRISGCIPPPGWFVDLNDASLLKFDPCFHTSTTSKDVAQFDSEASYWQTALPIADVSRLPLRTVPPLYIETQSSTKGTASFLSARKKILRGQIVGMDRSYLAVVENPTIHKAKEHSKSICDNAMKMADEDVTIQDKVEKLMATERKRRRDIQQHVMKEAVNCCNRGMELLVQTNILQLILSLFETYGDTLVLPPSHKTSVVGEFDQTVLCNARLLDRNQSGQEDGSFSAFTRTLIAKSETAHIVIKSILACDCLTTNSLHEDKVPLSLKEAARQVLECLPRELLCGVKAKGDFILLGFFARHGLHRDVTLARFIQAYEKYSVQVTSPGVTLRSAFFPEVQKFSHCCDPNCTLSFLETKDSHAVDETGKENSLSWAAFRPSVVVITALRPIDDGERLTVSAIPSTIMTYAMRQPLLQRLGRIRTHCVCSYCVREPDVARAFRCKGSCLNLEGVVCPVGDGSHVDEWVCLQCGWHPDMDYINRCIDSEIRLASVKANSAVGLRKLLEDEFLHYSHALVHRKLDAWSEEAWKAQDASLCLELIDALIKSSNRLLENNPVKAQYHEFAGQVHHALGNAHSALHEYFKAWQYRLRNGERFSSWCQETARMATKKTLTEFLDSK